jgi:hypothetical protein
MYTGCFVCVCVCVCLLLLMYMHLYSHSFMIIWWHHNHQQCSFSVFILCILLSVLLLYLWFEHNVIFNTCTSTVKCLWCTICFGSLKLPVYVESVLVIHIKLLPLT